jgi:tetratricopeptide (TPR) repeat protein
VKHYRERCLACHGEKLLKTHAKPADNCIACHMPGRKAKDGAHTVFTDHRIARAPVTGSQESAPVAKLIAWHEPRGALALRNLGLANIDIGERERSAEPDPVMLTKVGLVLVRKGEGTDAAEVLEYAVQLDPGRAGSHVNLGNAYKESGLAEKAIAEFERAIELDPSLESAYRSLAEIYSRAGNADGVRKTFERYLKFMPNSMTARKALLGSTSR